MLDLLLATSDSDLLSHLGKSITSAGQVAGKIRRGTTTYEGRGAKVRVVVPLREGKTRCEIRIRHDCADLGPNEQNVIDAKPDLAALIDTDAPL